MRKLWRSGEPFIWWSGGALALAVLLVGGLAGLVLVKGLGFFWPQDLWRVSLRNGRAILGEIDTRELIPQPGDEGSEAKYRIKMRQGNRDLTGADFLWVDESEITSRERPAGAIALERLEWGNFYGFLERGLEKGEVVAQGAKATRTFVLDYREAERDLWERIQEINRGQVGAISRRQERARLSLRGLELRGVVEGPRVEALREEIEECQGGFAALQGEVSRLREQFTREVVLRTADGREKALPLWQIVGLYRPNDMSVIEKIGQYLAKFWEFLSDEPRESNTEGGIFPALFGTALLVLLMSLFAAPLGVLAAFYLREYARQGIVVSLVRIAVNNLAGVPSIVFGVFGVGFFIYTLGGTIDRVFFAEALPTPTFGTGGILWASLTLALLTVPVVIVATEEGLAGVPTGIREGSLALGATKFETTWRVVLPAVAPSLLTGLILAMARAAGEVAPLMLTGVVKLAPSLPVDGLWPFVHLERKFMHLGFHIFDVGFQSPNVDAARPMVFATTLLLLVLVVTLNLVAIGLRNRLRKRFALSAV